jgi:hypothetical protein
VGLFVRALIQVNARGGTTCFSPEVSTVKPAHINHSCHLSLKRLEDKIPDEQSDERDV